MKPWSQLQPLLVCPSTGEPLHYVNDQQVMTDADRSFPLIQGVPILRAGTLQIKDVNHVSNGVSPAIREMMLTCDGPVLFLGAGSSEFRAEHIYEVEYDLFRNTDVVADAHALPFRNDTFELAVALNVFEHLREPHNAAMELHRVLRPGGRVLIHTAFLQILHEEPNHYYNATEFGVRNWFRSFEQLQINVSPNFNPFYGMSWMMHDLLYYVEATLGADERKKLERLTLAELAEHWRSSSCGNAAACQLLARLPPQVQSRFAAGFEVMASK